MPSGLWQFTAAFCACCLIALNSGADEAPKTSAAAEPATDATSLTWRHDLESAIDDAKRQKKPILVIVGAKWCLWCRKLEAEIEKPEVQKELADWVLADIDSDDNPDDARKLNIGPIPALRILGLDGRTLASHEGFLPAAKLLKWLDSFDQKEADGGVEMTIGDVREGAELNAETIDRLIRQLGHRDASVREAVIRRLASVKNLAAAPVVKAFSQGSLATRLTALELLINWKAPVKEADPWQPDSVTESMLNDLDYWASNQSGAGTSTPSEIEPLTPDQLEHARIEIQKFVAADPAEAEAIGARLTRIGKALLPEIRQQYQQADTDKIRERLDWLRFRLAASDALALKWPTGLHRLASTDLRTRREAASELSTMVSRGDEGLLTELFSHSDPFVRELSLKALHDVEGTRASDEISRLLLDPEPNVRAAVLKQLSEKPSPKLVSQIATYIAQEKDPDLIVHAVRLLRAIHTKDSIQCLIGQLEHSNWQVRAETVDALGEMLGGNSHFVEAFGAAALGLGGDTNQQRAEAKADAYAAMLELLPDQDGFVVSRVVNALKSSDFALAAQPLAKAAEDHPELAVEISAALTHGSNIRAKALPLMRSWLQHKDDRLRAAAITSLFNAGEIEAKTELLQALQDPSDRVRIAAATQLLTYCESERPSASNAGESVAVDEDASEVEVESTLLGSFWNGLKKNSRQMLDVIQSQLEKKEPADAAPESPKKEADVKTEPKTPVDVNPVESWLAQFRSGQKREPWLADAVKPLETMLNSDSESEQVPSALMLVALGVDEPALSRLIKLAGTQPHQIPTIAKALGWLPWNQRAAFFDQLRQLTRGPDQVAAICRQLVVLHDIRASQILWGLLAGDQLSGEFARDVFECLKQNHNLGDRYSNTPPKPKGVDFNELRRLASEGSIWQRRVALAFLLLLKEEKANEVAQAAYDDPQTSAPFRKDAFRILLMTASSKEAKTLIVKELADPDSVLIEPSLTYLTLGPGTMHSIADGEFYLEFSRNHQYTGQGEVDPPKELTVEKLRPLLSNKNEDIVAQAAYMLSILGEPDGIDRLIKRWRKAGSHDSQWESLVYKAIAALDDPKFVPILEEIYRTMEDRQYQVRDFYWAIRSMHGPAILQLRKRIRDEVGMDNLR